MLVSGFSLSDLLFLAFPHNVMFFQSFSALYIMCVFHKLMCCPLSCSFLSCALYFSLYFFSGEHYACLQLEGGVHQWWLGSSPLGVRVGCGFWSCNAFKNHTFRGLCIKGDDKGTNLLMFLAESRWCLHWECWGTTQIEFWKRCTIWGAVLNWSALLFSFKKEKNLRVPLHRQVLILHLIFLPFPEFAHIWSILQ